MTQVVSFRNKQIKNNTYNMLLCLAGFVVVVVVAVSSVVYGVAMQVLAVIAHAVIATHS